MDSRPHFSNSCDFIQNVHGTEHKNNFDEMNGKMYQKEKRK